MVDPTIIEVEVTGVGSSEVEAKLADGRLAVATLAEFVAGSPQVGSMIEVALLTRTDPKGRALVSRRWAVQHQSWQRLIAAKEAQATVVGTVSRSVKGGLSVDVDGLRAFLPSSLVDEHPPADVSPLIGQELEFTVVDLDRASDRIVVSRRDVVRRERRKAERSQWSSIAVGTRVEGKVVGFLDFGVQVELDGGVRGLIHRSELSWNRIHELADVVSIGDTVTVEVLEVNKSKRRVGLSLKRIESDPFGDLQVGQRLDAEVIRVVEYGCFVRIIDSSAEGLVHLTELTDQRGYRPDQLVTPGEKVAVKILEIDRKRRRLDLSIRQALLAE